MSAQDTAQVTAGLLILWLFFVLAMALLFAMAIVSYLKRRREIEEDQEPVKSSNPGGSRPYLPSVFERPCRWAVIKSVNLDAVKEVLGLENVRPCSWGEGLARNGEYALFLSPPIQGWIMVMGEGLPDPFEDIDACYHLMSKLTLEFGESQFYSFNRALNHHAWVRTERFRLTRAYAWADQVLWNQGPLTSEERQLGLRCYAYAEEPEHDPTLAKPHSLNAEKVTVLAARWSFDPSAVDATMLTSDQGLAAG